MSNDELKIEKARGHMSAVVAGLVATLGPVDAVGVLLGAAVGILSQEYGDEAAADWLRKTADEIQDDEGDNHVGHA